MALPCTQLPSLLRIEDKLDSVADSLQTLAVQKVEIDHIKTDQESMRRWVRSHEDSIQVLKLQPGKLATLIVYMLAGAGVSVSVGVILYVVTKS